MVEKSEEEERSLTQENQTDTIVGYNFSELSRNTSVLRTATPELTPRLDSGSLVCAPSPVCVGMVSLIIFGVEIEAHASHKHQESSLTIMQALTITIKFFLFQDLLLIMSNSKYMCVSVDLCT